MIYVFQELEIYFSSGVRKLTGYHYCLELSLRWLNILKSFRQSAVFGCAELRAKCLQAVKWRTRAATRILINNAKTFSLCSTLTDVEQYVLPWMKEFGSLIPYLCGCVCVRACMHSCMLLGRWLDAMTCMPKQQVNSSSVVLCPSWHVSVFH